MYIHIYDFLNSISKTYSVLFGGVIIEKNVELV